METQAINQATDYVELQALSNFSFLQGGAHPEELALTAATLGHRAIALTDINSVAGVVRAHGAAKDAGIRLLAGATLTVSEDIFGGGAVSPRVLALPADRHAYGQLTRLLSLGRRRAPKGECWLTWPDLAGVSAAMVYIIVPPEAADPGTDGDFTEFLHRAAAQWPGDCYLAASMLYRGDDQRRLAALAALAADAGTPLVATNNVLYHIPERRMLQDVLTAIRLHCRVEEAGFHLAANAERHLKTPEEMARLFRDYPDAIARTVEIAGRCRFSLDELRYEYPVDPVPAGLTPQAYLEQLTWAGARERYGDPLNERVAGMLRHELALIGELDYAPYFLTVYDIVRFARSRNILCQGRGSAANSAVCYCLNITAVDPDRIDLLFERFISSERKEPPDIDVDFEHERREEVLQYIYEKYGRDRAGLAATVTSYRAKSAVREVGKALGLSQDIVGALAGNVWGWSEEGVNPDTLAEIGLDARDPTLAAVIALSRQLIGFPRHLSQHVGGFVITKGPLSEVVPIENAAMVDRTVIQWDKDDLDALGILKIDCLGLGMLTCIAKAFHLLYRHYGKKVALATVPPKEKPVYDMLCRADSVGVFQVESRAQMTMLPRLKPQNFYDLVIEVAIVRPGPIQGDMVHPYLRRRNGEEEVSYPSSELRDVLHKTLGVPLFQEQAMRIAIVAAGFTPNEADRLRRAMATFRRVGTIHSFREKMIAGMVARDYDPDFAERCFKQIEGFGDYGFPESHAASFALLVYISAWLKCYYPAVFATAILNSQPMGFYAPAQLVRDAREHGVPVRAVDVNASEWDCTLEAVEGAAGRDRTGAPVFAVRLGFRQIKGFPQELAFQLSERRGTGYRTLEDLWQRAGLTTDALERLAHADAFRCFDLDRRQALWRLKALGEPELPLFAAANRRDTPMPTDGSETLLPDMPLGEHVVDDYDSIRLSLKAHPMTFLRPGLQNAGIVRNNSLRQRPDGQRLSVAGLVLVRQRPGTASGVIFSTLEDETGIANLVIWPAVFEKYRRAVFGARLLVAHGKLQRDGMVIHIIVDKVEDQSHQLQQLLEQGGELGKRLSPKARNFH